MGMQGSDQLGDPLGAAVSIKPAHEPDVVRRRRRVDGEMLDVHSREARVGPILDDFIFPYPHPPLQMVVNGGLLHVFGDDIVVGRAGRSDGTGGECGRQRNIRV